MRDRDVRQAVREWLGAEHAGDDDTRLVEEMNLWSGTVRIDFAVINGALTGLELKSDRDTLERLPRQRAVYDRIFDYVSLIVGERHAAKAQPLIPKWWGVRVAVMSQGRVTLEWAQRPSFNPSPDAYLIAELLNKREAIEVLAIHDLADRWRSKGIRAIHERLAAELTLDVLRAEVRSKLKARPRGATAWLPEPARYAG